MALAIGQAWEYLLPWYVSHISGWASIWIITGIFFNLKHLSKNALFVAIPMEWSPPKTIWNPLYFKNSSILDFKMSKSSLTKSPASYILTFVNKLPFLSRGGKS